MAEPHADGQGLLLLNETTKGHVRMKDTFDVVANDQDQHSIWPKAKSVPLGWHSKGFSGTKEQCLEYIRKNWTDIRPKSLRD